MHKKVAYWIDIPNDLLAAVQQRALKQAASSKADVAAVAPPVTVLPPAAGAEADLQRHIVHHLAADDMTVQRLARLKGVTDSPFLAEKDVENPREALEQYLKREGRASKLWSFTRESGGGRWRLNPEAYVDKVYIAAWEWDGDEEVRTKVANNAVEKCHALAPRKQERVRRLFGSYADDHVLNPDGHVGIRAGTATTRHSSFLATNRGDNVKIVGVRDGRDQGASAAPLRLSPPVLRGGDDGGLCGELLLCIGGEAGRAYEVVPADPAELTRFCYVPAVPAETLPNGEEIRAAKAVAVPLLGACTAVCDRKRGLNDAAPDAKRARGAEEEAAAAGTDEFEIGEDVDESAVPRGAGAVAKAAMVSAGLYQTNAQLPKAVRDRMRADKAAAQKTGASSATRARAVAKTKAKGSPSASRAAALVAKHTKEELYHMCRGRSLLPDESQGVVMRKTKMWFATRLLQAEDPPAAAASPTEVAAPLPAAEAPAELRLPSSELAPPTAELRAEIVGGFDFEFSAAAAVADPALRARLRAAYNEVRERVLLPEVAFLGRYAAECAEGRADLEAGGGADAAELHAWYADVRAEGGALETQVRQLAADLTGASQRLQTVERLAACGVALEPPTQSG